MQGRRSSRTGLGGTDLDRPRTYVRILFVDFSSAFNTIIPNLLLPKLTQFSVPISVCQWSNNFLTDRQQLVRLGKYKSSTSIIITGAPQGCVLSPLLFSLYPNNCTSKYPSVKLLKFVDDTTLISLFQDSDESAYRQEVKELEVWCCLNNLELNTLKTVEIIMNSTVTTVESFRFLGTTMSQDLNWDIHIDSIVKKAQQRLYFLRQLRKFNLPQELLKQFYSAIIESVLCTSITVWFSSATKSDLRRLQRVVRTAERIIGTTLPTLQELYSSRMSKRAVKITLDPHIQHTPSLNCCCLVDATELWVPERPDTGTVSSLRQSISWTLDNNCGTHTIYTLIYLTHILSLHFNLHIICLYIQLSIVIYLYIQLSICINCIHLLFLIYFCIVLFIIFVFCSVTVILLHCGSLCHENKFLIYVHIYSSSFWFWFCSHHLVILIMQKITHITFKLYQQQLCQSID